MNYWQRSNMENKRSCVIIVENLPVPFDRRVWQEAQALSRAGWRVSVICPRTERYPAAFERLDSIDIYRHPLPVEARGKWAFVAEYSAALFHEIRLLLKIWRKEGFAFVQACNPPDLIFLAVVPFKLLGVKFIFDQHDLSPELYEVKFGRRGLLHSLLLLFERLSYRMADVVITANESFRDIAISRGQKRPQEVCAIYSFPTLSRIYRGTPAASVRHGVGFVIGYVGIIGDQDGVDHLVRAVDVLIKRGFNDFRAAIVGDGPAMPAVRALARELNVEPFIMFAGYRSGDDLVAHLSAFDIGVIPDPVNGSNDLMSMNKVFEYSALGIPTVSYKLTETMRLLGDAGIYAITNNPEGLAAACQTLLEDPALRKQCSERAVRLSKEKFIWENEAAKYVAAVERVAPSGGKPQVAAKSLEPADKILG